MTVAYSNDPVAAGIAQMLEARGYSIVPSENPGRLVAEEKADIAIGDALGYARNLGLAETALIPGFAMTLDGLGGYIRLLFRPNSTDVRRIAITDRTATSSVVAGLVLIEKHEIEPEIVVVGTESDPPLMLENADGAVLTGIEALLSHRRRESGLDLADEWLDMTEGRLPYLLAWGRTSTVSQGVVDEFTAAVESFRLSLPDLAARHEKPEAIEQLHESILSERISFELDGEGADTLLTPLFHYAFYHGIIDDIPSIRFLPITTDDNGA